MKKFTVQRSKKKGLAPGTLVHIGEKHAARVRITTVEFNETTWKVREAVDAAECATFTPDSAVRWVDVAGIHSVDVIAGIGAKFGIHPLVLEDILNTGQRPKLETWNTYTYIVLKMLRYDATKNEISSEQVSIVLGKDTVISFREKDGDEFHPIVGRIANESSKMRSMGADYLAYALIDAIVDNYFAVLEQLGDNIERLEEEMLAAPDRETAKKIHYLKRELIFIRQSGWPLREVVSALERGESPQVHEPSQVYLRDLYDHVIQIIETIELFRDMLSGMIDIYLSSINNRMNEVMKLLTIITTIFIPISFIAGVYGMNFDFMPGIHMRYGYYAAVAIMIAIALLMVAYFRKKKWF